MGARRCAGVGNLCDARTVNPTLDLVKSPLAICILCIYSSGMRFQYDSAKAAANQRKHGVSFADAEGYSRILSRLPSRTRMPKTSLGSLRLEWETQVNYLWRFGQSVTTSAA